MAMKNLYPDKEVVEERLRLINDMLLELESERESLAWWIQDLEEEKVVLLKIDDLRDRINKER